MIKSYLMVAAGSALGGVARVALSSALIRRWGTSFPWGTLAVNLAGCFLIGVLVGVGDQRWRMGSELRLLLMAGFCGGFTTFSTFALEVSTLFKSGSPGYALIYMMASGALGVGLFGLGAWAARGGVP
ncbi:MAG: fluoride efflux transporter CrcB [Elusimicrobia bacterium]|nr:fluoride efflux transporter CrcB [Elusimicrobiota bacterium]